MALWDISWYTITMPTQQPAPKEILSAGTEEAEAARILARAEHESTRILQETSGELEALRRSTAPDLTTRLHTEPQLLPREIFPTMLSALNVLGVAALTATGISMILKGEAPPLWRSRKT
jgi:hypothetical protein